MPDAFDPYLRWLGIRDPGRPPNHYRLLGLDVFESDSDVIAVAADRQMAHVRTFQTGQFAALSQRVLNELAVARICLLKPEKKAVYDALLKKQMGAATIVSRPKEAAATSGAGEGGANSGAAGVGAPREEPARVVAAKEGRPNVRRQETAAAEFPDFASLASATSPGSRAASSGAKKLAASTRKSKLLAPWIGLAAAGILLVVGVIVAQQMGGSTEVATTNGPKMSSPDASGTVAPSKAASPNPAQTKGNAPEPKPAPPKLQPHPPTPVSVPTDHGSTATPAAVPPVLPSPKSSPPEPPVHPPQDVIRVENPAQANPVLANPARPSPAHPTVASNPPTQVAQVDTGKPSTNGNNTESHDQVAPSPSKEPAPPREPAAESKPKRTPVPSKEQVTAAEAKVQKLFNVSATKKPDERAALAKTLFEQGVDPNNQVVDRYVLLRLATKDAAALGDSDLAFRAADKLGEMFDINTLEEKASLLSTLSRSVRTPTTAESLANIADTLLNESLDADEYDSAKEIAQMAAGLAARGGNPSQAKEFRQRAIEIERIKKEYGAAMIARDSLKSKPDDPDANQVWGYFLGPVKGDFDKALPFLAKSGDDRFKSLAKKELAKPTEAPVFVELADGWAAIAEKSKPNEMANIQEHACELYRLALQNLKGIARTDAEQKLAKIDRDKRRTIAPVRMDQITKVLTAGRWRIQWKSSVWEAKYNADHTFLAHGQSGTWTLESGLVQCRWKDHPTWLQTIRMANDHFEIEAFVGGKLDNTGVGTLIAP